MASAIPVSWTAAPRNLVLAGLLLVGAGLAGCYDYNGSYGYGGYEAYGYPYDSGYDEPYGYGFYGAYPYGPSYGLGFSNYGYYRHRHFYGRRFANAVPHGNFNNRGFVPPSVPPANLPSANLRAMRSSRSFANAPSLRNGTMNAPRMGGNMRGSPWFRSYGNR